MEYPTKPIGQIIVENGDLTPKVLRSILHRQGEDLLRSVELFKNLPQELIAKIARVAEYQAFPKDKTIIHQGDQADSFYQIISGSARVFRVSEDGVNVTLNTLEYLIDHYSRQAGKNITGIDLDAYKSIMAYDWPGNTDELSAVIRRAVNLAQNSLLIPEDILIGTAPRVTERLSFNLLKVDRIRRLFQSSAFPGSAQLVAAIFFVLIIYLGFFGNQTPTHNVSLELIWGLWEPLVILSCILAARIWCAVCPVGASSSFISQKYGLSRNVPSFIRNYGSYLAVAGIVAIFWSEVVFNMPFSSRATAILILSISVPALILALVYRRRVWCRFLCPLGKLVGFLSRCSILELRANQNICNNDCMDNSCYVGKDQQAGCPVFEAPFILHNNQDCILCGNCVKNCANQVPALNLRIPGQELWTFRKPDLTMAFLVSFIMGAQIFRGLEKTDYFHKYATTYSQPWIFYSVFILLSISLAYLFIRMAGNLALGSKSTPVV